MSAADDIISQIAEITSKNGANVSVSRIVSDAAPTRDIFGNQTNNTNQSFTLQVIVESLEEKLVQTVAGTRNMATLSMIANPGVLLMRDEITFAGHVYRVKKKEPVNFTGQDVVEMVEAVREVD